MERPFLFRCPTTGLTVQGMVGAEPPEDESRRYTGIECTACGRMHLVNVATLKLLSEETHPTD